jgi:hypothetical protein
VEGTYYAGGDTSTHRGGSLSEGDVQGTMVTCPWHGADPANISRLSQLFSISRKCTDAVYSHSRAYSVSMSFPAPLSLYHYFVVAARMHHHFESNLVAVEESGVAALQDPDLAAFELFSGPRGNFMYYWYASLCVVVQGFRHLKLVDPRVAECQGAPPVLEWRLSSSARLLFREVARTHASSRLHRMGARVDGSFSGLLRSRNQAR